MMSESQLWQQVEAMQQRVEAMRQEVLIEEAFQKYLAKCIQNNHRCAHCYLNHNGACSVTKECFENDQKYYNDEDEE